ncbi:MAG: beta-phosphoglucomutase [Planctomycetia bacterium]|nr:beta-phosphoglucomutase [Planctomycetia bacterium]
MTRELKAVIFDLDGVITDTARLHYAGWKRLADEIGVPFSEKDNEALKGVSRMDSLKRLLGNRAADFSETQLQEMAARKNGYYVESLASLSPDDILPGAEDLVGAITKAGLTVVLASASKNTRRILEQLKITEWFDEIIDGNDFTRSKPDPEVYLLSCTRLAIEPGEAVVVEDAPAGIEAAKAAGCAAVGVGSFETLKLSDRVVSSLAEVSVEGLRELICGGK